MAREKKSPAPAQEAAHFESVEAVLEHLKAAGRKCSQPKLYKDLKENKLQRLSCGGFSLKAVSVYAKNWTQPLPGQHGDDQDKLRDRLLEEQIRDRGARARMAEMELAEREGKLISREEADQQMAMAVTVLKSGLKSFIGGNVLEIVHAAAGDPTKADAVTDLFMNKLNSFFNGFSRRREVTVAMPEMETDHDPDDAA